MKATEPAEVVVVSEGGDCEELDGDDELDEPSGGLEVTSSRYLYSFMHSTQASNYYLEEPQCQLIAASPTTLPNIPHAASEKSDSVCHLKQTISYTALKSP
ncbi:unnamed protein product [Hymenolepis diminuta]|uniref:Uncharacterized protein n=1 Tax=Hymenolepis diminuta TaxID=6216 RepID=A0A564Y2T1_HYMDI|nr:unnamed protein product [Hymenolepis diminuta]